MPSAKPDSSSESRRLEATLHYTNVLLNLDLQATKRAFVAWQKERGGPLSTPAGLDGWLARGTDVSNTNLFADWLEELSGEQPSLRILARDLRQQPVRDPKDSFVAKLLSTPGDIAVVVPFFRAAQKLVSDVGRVAHSHKSLAVADVQLFDSIQRILNSSGRDPADLVPDSEYLNTLRSKFSTIVSVGLFSSDITIEVAIHRISEGKFGLYPERRGIKIGGQTYFSDKNADEDVAVVARIMIGDTRLLILGGRATSGTAALASNLLSATFGSGWIERVRPNDDFAILGVPRYGAFNLVAEYGLMPG